MIVIGAGVIGLTVATELQRAGHEVEIQAEFWPDEEDVNYTSPWAGALFRPSPAITAGERREEAWMAVSLQRMLELANEPGSGVGTIREVNYYEAPSQALLDGAFPHYADFQLLHELPDGVVYGCEYTSVHINSPVYLAFLLRRLRLNGATTRRRRLAHLEQPADEIVVNCSGSGFADAQMHITRGQTVLVKNRFEKIVTRANADGSVRYIIPRPQGGTVVGGTLEVDDWFPHARPETRQAILRDAEEYGLKNVEVVRDIVGRRPSRKGGPRVERENNVVHAYGVGWNGYEVSWGVATEVCMLVQAGLQ